MMSSKNDYFHCRTHLKEEKLFFTWNIVNFSQIYEMKEVLNFEGPEYFNFQMTYDGNNALFNCYNVKDEGTGLLNRLNTICFSVFLKINETFHCVVTPTQLKFDNYATLYKLPYAFVLANKSIYLIKDTLTIRFKLKIFIKTVNRIIYNIFESFASLRNNSDSTEEISEKKTDSIVTFIINTERLRASKHSLCSKSKVFEAMFNSGLEESINNEVRIVDIKYDILKELLYFVHSGCLSKPIKSIDISAICELFIAAEKYHIEDLKSQCEQRLIKKTTKNNVIEYLKFAYLNNGKILEEYTKSFIKLYLCDIIDTPEFLPLMEMHPELLTEIKNMGIDEL